MKNNGLRKPSSCPDCAMAPYLVVRPTKLSFASASLASSVFPVPLSFLPARRPISPLSPRSLLGISFAIHALSHSATSHRPFSCARVTFGPSLRIHPLRNVLFSLFAVEH